MSMIETTQFHTALRAMRVKYFTKQSVLAVTIGVTDVAISHWENGARVPNQASFGKVLDALGKEGASVDEMTWLQRSRLRSLSERVEAARRNSKTDRRARRPRRRVGEAPSYTETWAVQNNRAEGNRA